MIFTANFPITPISPIRRPTDRPTDALDIKHSRGADLPGYRNAWDDCGGIGASATERMRTIAAKIKGWAKPLPFVRRIGARRILPACFKDFEND